jgi:formamidopyrimidine-DNA glycosylase
VPELPEVETVRRGLAQHVTGREVASVEVLHPRAVRRDPGLFATILPGHLMELPQRRGKYLWLPLAAAPSVTSAAPSAATSPSVPTAPPVADGSPAEQALLAHLGMSGQLLVGDPDRPLSPHVRVRFTFTDGGPDLRFTDQRTFGHLAVVPFATGLTIPAPIAHIAPDPLEPEFDPADFAARLRRRRTGVKRALLDQSLISGVGNIYADESLWRAKLHWARATDTLTKPEITRLLEAINEVLNDALKVGGTSFDSLYVNVNGESGYFDRSLGAYGRAGLPCERCGTPIRRDSFMNRSSFTCPRCQPLPRGNRLHR